MVNITKKPIAVKVVGHLVHSLFTTLRRGIFFCDIIDGPHSIYILFLEHLCCPKIFLYDTFREQPAEVQNLLKYCAAPENIPTKKMCSLSIV